MKTKEKTTPKIIETPIDYKLWSIIEQVTGHRYVDSQILKIINLYEAETKKKK